MTRREAAWLVTRIGATLAGQQFLTAWSEHAQGTHAPEEPERWAGYKPRFFSPDDFRTLEQCSEILMPSDETPGAREAHVAAFIDFILFSSAEFAPDTQIQWREAMGWLRQHEFGGGSPEQQLALVTRMSEPGDSGFANFQLIKDLTVYGFYTSRVGLIDNLEYKGLAYLTEFPGCSHPEHNNL